MWCIGYWTFTKEFLYQHVMGSNPMSSKTFNQPSNDRVPCGNPHLGHVAHLHFHKKCHLSTSEWFCHLPNQPTDAMPCVSMLCQHDDIIMTSRWRKHWLFFACWLFTCLGKQSEWDNSRIKCLFEEVNIWLESAWRVGRNGIGFIWFRELSVLIIFWTWGASSIRF